MWSIRQLVWLAAALLAVTGHPRAAAAQVVQAKRPRINLVPRGPDANTHVLKRNCAYFGWYLDDGKLQYGSVGQPQSLDAINKAVGTPAHSWGAYDHIHADTYVRGDPSTHYNGSEFLPYLQPAIDAKDTTIFVASPLPIHGYDGFTADDTTQLDALIAVLKQFVDAGVTVWLRWAHEPSWYTRKGSDRSDPTGQASYYNPDPGYFVQVWQVIYTKMKAELPSVLHMWCANNDPLDRVWPFWPGAEYVDLVGLDYYGLADVPKDFYYTMPEYIQEAHDTFAVQFDKPFWLGEMGTRSSDPADNLAFVDTMTSVDTCNRLPKYQGMMYFNYHKNNVNHYIVEEGGSPSTTAFAELFGSVPGDANAPTPALSHATDASPEASARPHLAFNLGHLGLGIINNPGEV